MTRALYLALALALFGQPGGAQQAVQDLIDGALGGGAPAEEAPADAPAEEAPADAPAEEAAADAPAEGEDATVDVADERSMLASRIPEYDDWLLLVERAEATVAAGVGSVFSLNRLRDELSAWRERFSGYIDENAGRIATLEGQIAALGPAPEDGLESAEVAARREVLQEQLAALRSPDRLSAEAHARAQGLISEIDTLIRAREADRLRERGPSPLNPAYWPEAAAALGEALEQAFSDTAAGIRAQETTGALPTRLARAAGFALLAWLLMVWGRRQVKAAQVTAGEWGQRWRAIGAFVISLGEIVLPLLGLLALVTAFRQLRIWQVHAEPLYAAIYASGALIVIAMWLNRRLFPDRGVGPLGYGDDARMRIRRQGMSLSLGLGVIILLSAVLELAEPSEVALAVVILPVQIVVAVFLYRLGMLLRRSPVEETALPGSGGRIRGMVGLLAMAVAVATPVLSALGYAAASDALFQPAVLTLAILGAVIILQSLVYDIFAASERGETEDAGPLLPVLIGFALFIVALPFLALAWGTRPAELWEIWTRISEGFQIGETRVSPAEFITVIVVFVIGYILVRFVQGLLRSTVMPRTRLDLGGQNAVVAGVGYVGIALAAVAAITSGGINLTSLAVVAGALSVGIGFGLQNIVQNFVSGIILLIERPIGEGDMIEVNGQLGYVRDISVRSTRIETFDKRDVIVPNADLVSGQVTNWTRGNSAGRLIVPVGVAYGSDTEKVREILLDVAENHPMVLADPKPQVFFLAFGDSSLNFEMRVILRDVSWIIVTQSEMHFEIDRRFREAGIEIPFPQRDLWLRNAAELKEAAPGPATRDADARPAEPESDAEGGDE